MRLKPEPLHRERHRPQTLQPEMKASPDWPRLGHNLSTQIVRTCREGEMQVFGCTAHTGCAATLTYSRALTLLIPAVMLLIPAHQPQPILISTPITKACSVSPAQPGDLLLYKSCWKLDLTSHVPVGSGLKILRSLLRGRPFQGLRGCKHLT